MHAFAHILVPTDFEPPADRALEIAIMLGAQFDAALTLLHVTDVPRVTYDGPPVWPLDELATQAKTAIEAALAELEQRCPNCEGLVRAGDPPQQIVDTAHELGADLIVMGRHGRRGLPRMLLGDVAEKVIRTSSLPVLTVCAQAS